MDNAKQHWKILQELGTDLANRVRSFMVINIHGNGVIVATEDGQGYWLGRMGFGWGETKIASEPTPLNVPGLVQMAQSNRHILLLNKRGQIYSMGSNQDGQLGLGNDRRETHFLPQLIPSSHKFISVRCGSQHSLALTEDGKVWAWGLNEWGQVGAPISSISFSSSLRQISELDSHHVVAVEAGGYHSLALTDQCKVYSWGWNCWGQLGYESESSQQTPTQIITSSPVKSMAAGYQHTLLLTQTGEVWFFGRNDFSCVESTVDLMTLLHIPIESNHRLSKVEGLPPISQIISDIRYSLSIAMSSDQRCFIWGELRGGTVITTPQELPPIYSTVESPLTVYSHCNTQHSIQVPEPPLILSARMFRMFDNPKTSDVQFLVEEKTIHAHRIILSNSSDYFARMFSERPSLAPVDLEDPIVRVTITDHSYQVFHTFLRFIYTDCFEPHSDLLPELFDLASKYLEFDLKQVCLSRMLSTLTPTNCCLYYQLTLRHSLLELETFQQELVQFISTNFLEVINSVAYQSMDAELCKKLTISMASHSP